MRLQNAIEYLTTYSWAIIIIAIVVAALFALRVFSPAPQTECVMPAGFTCENIYMSQNGMLLVDIFQTTTQAINVTGIECNSNDTILGAYMQQPDNPPSNQVTIQMDSNYTFPSIQCYYSGAPFNAVPGAVYRGALIVNYTDQDSGFQHSLYGTVVVPVS